MGHGVGGIEEEDMAGRFDDYFDEIRGFPSTVKLAIEHAPDDRLVDVLGEVNSVATRIGALKRIAASEVHDGDHGEQWQVEQKRRGKRSYNTGGLLYQLGEQMYYTNTLALLMDMISLGVISLKWNWSPLKELMQQHNLDLRRATHEIEDDDPDYDYGEYWEDANPRYVPIEKEAK
jgi:hypothetical protein